MDKTALVGFDVEKGSRILQILDDAGLQVAILASGNAVDVRIVEKAIAYRLTP